MTPISLPPSRLFAEGYPQIQRSVSASRAGERAMAFVEWADPFWIVQLKTNALQPEDRLLLEVFKDACREGLTTVLYTPHARPVPRVYWNDRNNAALANGALVSVTNGTQLVMSATNGLVLGPGDLFSLTTGEYNSLFRVQSGATASGGTIAVVVEPDVPAYITTGAVARFKNPIANMRQMPGTFEISSDFFPTASLTLVEIPK